MKLIIAVILVCCLIFVSGCWVNKYVHDTYDPTTGKLVEHIQFDYAKSMVTSNTGSVDVNFPDGFNLSAKNISLIYDPNSWTKIGNVIIPAMLLK